MSLIVWCPLINDLHNQGISSTNLSGGGSFVSSGGKIGSGCFHLTTGGTWVTIPELVDKQAFSICCWVKIVTSETFSNRADCWTVEANADGLIAPCRLERYNQDNKTLLSWRVAKKHETAPYLSISNTSSDSTWVHTVLTYDGTNFKSYANGILRTTVAKSSFATSFKLSGRVRLGDSNSSTYLNDFRIYDRALSEQEIKELSKGLVCHYTLGSADISNANLAAGDVFVNTPITVGTNYTIILLDSNFFGLNAGDTYTIRYYLKCPSVKGGKIRILFYSTSDNRTSVYGDYLSANESGWVTYTGTLTSTQRGYTTMHICIQNLDTSVTSSDTFYVSLLQVEKASGPTLYNNTSTGKIYDSSGYCHNGTLSSSLSPDSNTPRYNKAILFPANSESTITTPLSIDNSAWTISFWEKCDWTNVETSSPYIVYWENYIRIRKHSTSGRMRALYYYKDSEGTQASTQLYFMSAIGTDTSWKHFVLTFDGSTLKTYLNGTLSASSNLPSGFSLYDINGNFILNYTAETISKSLSDVRVYATALSADDVTELYNLGA